MSVTVLTAARIAALVEKYPGLGTDTFVHESEYRRVSAALVSLIAVADYGPERAMAICALTPCEQHYFESWNDTCRYCGEIKPDSQAITTPESGEKRIIGSAGTGTRSDKT